MPNKFLKTETTKTIGLYINLKRGQSMFKEAKKEKNTHKDD